MSAEAATRSGSEALARLRTATRPHHDRIESALDLMRPDLDLGAYRRFVERSFSFISACEATLDIANAPAMLALRARLKTGLLRSNLRALGMSDHDVDGLAMPGRIPSIGAWPQALGYLYVIEGSTLGGQVLARHFRALLGVPDDALAFVLSYGRDVGPMWKTMLQVLDSALEEPSAEPAIVATARDTFELLTHWHGLS